MTLRLASTHSDNTGGHSSGPVCEGRRRTGARQVWHEPAGDARAAAAHVQRVLRQAQRLYRYVCVAIISSNPTRLAALERVQFVLSCADGRSSHALPASLLPLLRRCRVQPLSHGELQQLAGTLLERRLAVVCVCAGMQCRCVQTTSPGTDPGRRRGGGAAGPAHDCSAVRHPAGPDRHERIAPRAAGAGWHAVRAVPVGARPRAIRGALERHAAPGAGL